MPCIGQKTARHHLFLAQFTWKILGLVRHFPRKVTKEALLKGQLYLLICLSVCLCVFVYHILQNCWCCLGKQGQLILPKSSTLKESAFWAEIWMALRGKAKGGDLLEERPWRMKSWSSCIPPSIPASCMSLPPASPTSLLHAFSSSQLCSCLLASAGSLSLSRTPILQACKGQTKLGHTNM